MGGWIGTHLPIGLETEGGWLPAPMDSRQGSGGTLWVKQGGPGGRGEGGETTERHDSNKGHAPTAPCQQWKNSGTG